MFARVRELFRMADEQREVGYVDDALQSGHRLGVDGLYGVVTDEEQSGTGMVDDVMDLFAVELVQDGHGDGSVGQRGKEGDCPVRRVTAADGYLVALVYIAVLKEDMQFLYLSRYIVELQGRSLIVGQGVLIPIVDDGPLDICVKTTESFH